MSWLSRIEEWWPRSDEGVFLVSWGRNPINERRAGPLGAVVVKAAGDSGVSLDPQLLSALQVLEIP